MRRSIKDFHDLWTHTPVLAQVIVVRKVLLMSTFQLYGPLFAVLLATGLVMISLGIHIFARPFEDAGTNWVEMLTLTSQLFLLVAGPVFKTLVRDRHTRRACRPREDVGTHERRRRVDRTILTTAWKAEWRPRSARALSFSAPQRLSWYGAHRLGRERSGLGPSRASRAPQRVQALSLSTLTQVHVWREVRTTGHDHEHDDYKARMHRCPHLQQRNMC